MTVMRGATKARSLPAPRRPSGQARGRLLASTALSAAALLLVAPAAAAPPAPAAMPAGGVVTAGAAAIGQSGTTTTVTQASQRAAINWQSFNVGAQATVQFAQPNAAAVALNRVVGANPSQIAGRIDANGQVMLVNQDGVLFYRGAQVNTAGLVVSAAGISDRNFMAGRLVFDQPAHPGARIVNAGTLTLRQAGLAALVAPAVGNAGVINAKLGHVVLAGANTAILDLYGDGLVALDVSNQVTQVPAGQGGAPVEALVTNTGTILAPGGSVQLTARAVDGIVQTLVSAGGTIAAPSVGAQTGTVVLSGVGGGIVIAGTLLAQGTDPGTAGGRIAVLPSGTATLAATARLDASGTAGGGVIAVGTTLRRAARGPSMAGARQSAGVAVARGARLAADATVAGPGGRVAVLSAGTTAMNGSISARGGPQGGGGGGVEVSGLALALGGTVDLAAPRGGTGTLLLDPLDLYVADAAPAPATYAVTAGDLPGIPAGGANGPTAISWVTPALLAGQDANIALAAGRNIVFASGTAGANQLDLGSHALSVTAGNDIAIDKGFTITAGTLSLTATAGQIALGTAVGAAVGLGTPASPAATELAVGGTLSMQAATGFVLGGGTIVAGAAGIAAPGGSTIDGGVILSTGADGVPGASPGTGIAIAAGPVALSGGTLAAIGTANADIRLAELTQSGGVISAHGGITAGGVTQSGGTIVAAGDLTLAALAQSGGAIGAGGSVLIGSGTGAAGAAGSAATGGSVVQTGGTLLGQGNVVLWTQGVLTNDGVIAAGGQVAATAAAGIAQAGTLAGLGGVRLLASAGDAAQAAGGVVAAGTLAGTGAVIQSPRGTNSFTSFTVANAVQAIGGAPSGEGAPAPAAAAGARVDVTLVGASIDLAGNLVAGTLQLYSRYDTTEQPGVALDALALTGSAGVAASWTPPAGLAALGWSQALLGWTGPALGNATLGTIPALSGGAAATLSNPNAIGTLADYATTGTLSLADGMALTLGGLTLAGNPVNAGATAVLTGQVAAGLLGGDATLAAAGSLSIAAGASLTASGSVTLAANTALLAASVPPSASGSLVLDGGVSGATVGLYAAQDITEATGAGIAARLLTGRAGLLAGDPALPANWRVSEAGTASLAGSVNDVATLGTFLATGGFTLADGPLTVLGPVLAGDGLPGIAANLTLDSVGALLVQGMVGNGATAGVPGLSAGTTLLATGGVTVAGSGAVAAAGQALIATAGAFVLAGGTVAAGAIVIDAPGGSTIGGGAIATTGTGGDGIAIAAGPVTLNAGTISATGTGNADIALAGLTQAAGTVSASGGLVATAVAQSGGTVLAAGNLELGALQQSGGTIGAGGALGVGGGTGTAGAAGSAARSGRFDQTGGTLLAQGDVVLWSTGRLTNDGLVTAGGQVAATAAGGISQGGTLAGRSGVMLLASAGDAAQAAGGLVLTGAAGAVIQAPAGTTSFGNVGLAAPAGQAGPDVTLIGATIDISRALAAATLQLYSEGNTTEQPGAAIAAATLTGSAGVAATPGLFDPGGGLPAGLAALGWTPALLGWTAPSPGNATLGGANAIGRLADYAATGTLALAAAAPLALTGRIAAGGDVTLATAGSLSLAAGAQLTAPGTLALASGGTVAEAAGAAIAAGTLATLSPGIAGDLVLAGSNTIGALGNLAVGGRLALADTVSVREAAGAVIAAATLSSLGTIGGAASLAGTANAIGTLADFAAGTTLALTDGAALTLAGTIAAPLITIAAPASPVTLANGATIATGGIAQPANLPSSPVALPLLPSPAATGAGAYLITGSFTQQGSSSVIPLGGGPASVLGIATGHGGDIGFDAAQGLAGATTWLTLTAGAAARITGNVFVKALTVVYAAPAGGADLFGTIDQVAGLPAAVLAGIAPAPSGAFLFNTCPIHAANCGLLPGMLPPPMLPPPEVIPAASPLENFPIETLLNGNDEDLLLPETLPAASPLKNFSVEILLDRNDEDDLLLPLVTDRDY